MKRAAVKTAVRFFHKLLGDVHKAHCPSQRRIAV